MRAHVMREGRRATLLQPRALDDRRDAGRADGRFQEVKQGGGPCFVDAEDPSQLNCGCIEVESNI